MTDEIQTEQVVYDLNDLQIVAKLIAAVSQRGAIRADEMVVVGGLYNKTIQILQMADAVPSEIQGALPAEQDEAEPEAEAEVEGE